MVQIVPGLSRSARGRSPNAAQSASAGAYSSRCQQAVGWASATVPVLPSFQQLQATLRSAQAVHSEPHPGNMTIGQTFDDLLK